MEVWGLSHLLSPHFPRTPELVWALAQREKLVRIKNWVPIIRPSLLWSSHQTLSPSRSPFLTTPNELWLRSITSDRPTDVQWAEGIKQVASYVLFLLSPPVLRKSRNAGVHKFLPKKKNLWINLKTLETKMWRETSPSLMAHKY